MIKIRSLKKPILEMILGTIIIVITCFASSRLSLYGFKLPEFVRVDTVGQELSDSIHQRVLDKELYFLYALKEGDTVAFTDLIQYNKQIYVATGYLLHDGSKFPWFVTLKRLRFFDYYIYEEDGINIFDNSNYIDDNDIKWTDHIDLWYFANLDIYVSPNDLRIKGETQMDDDRILLCLVALASFYSMSWSRYKKKKREVTDGQETP